MTPIEQLKKCFDAEFAYTAYLALTVSDLGSQGARLESPTGYMEELLKVVESRQLLPDLMSQLEAAVGEQAPPVQINCTTEIQQKLLDFFALVTAELKNIPNDVVLRLFPAAMALEGAALEQLTERA